MKYLKLFENFLNEDSSFEQFITEEEGDTVEIDSISLSEKPAMAQDLLKQAVSQHNDKYQDSYTVTDTRKMKHFQFGTTSALYGMVGIDIYDGDDAAEFGVNINSQTMEWFYGDFGAAGYGEDGKPIKYNPEKLSSVIKAFTQAYKLAKSSHEKAAQERK